MAEVGFGAAPQQAFLHSGYRHALLASFFTLRVSIKPMHDQCQLFGNVLIEQCHLAYKVTGDRGNRS